MSDNTNATASAKVISTTKDGKDGKEREEKYSANPNPLGYGEMPDLIGSKLGQDLIGSELDVEFRWKDLFARIQQRNEIPALMVFRLLKSDPLLQAHTEHFLETFIRKHLSSARQNKLETDIAQTLSGLDQQSVKLLEDMIQSLPANVSISEIQNFWKISNCPRHIIFTMAKRHNVDPDEMPLDELGIQIFRAIHSHKIKNHPVAGSTFFYSGATGATGPTVPSGSPAAATGATGGSFTAPG